MNSSQYINDERRNYSLYVLETRAIPWITDGLKASARRVLWVARNGHHYKTATLAGATMPYHPHGDQSISQTICTLAAFYGNNIPLFKGEGAFGTLLAPNSYGAARYTSVEISKFTKDVVFADLDIIPMTTNYDDTLEEPLHFLPLIPVALLNPQEGIAVGFATNILSRDLKDIVDAQIKHLNGKRVKDVAPYFGPTDNRAILSEPDKNGDRKWVFHGTFERKGLHSVVVTKIPYGLTHEKFLDKLAKMEESEEILEIVDNSKDVVNIAIKFSRGVINDLSDDEVLKKLGLIVNASENLNLLDFTGKTVATMTFAEVIQKFTDWRLEWYVKRYTRLLDLITIDIQKYQDIILAIEKNVGSIARKIESRSELKEMLSELGIVYVDYIADLPVYRFTLTEKRKVEAKLEEALGQKALYERILSRREERIQIYINELSEVLKAHNKGAFITVV